MSLQDLLLKLISPIKNLFAFHKKKMLFLIMSILISAVVLFPFSDLTFFSQSKINALIKNNGQVSYSKINFSFLPFGVRTQDFKFLSKKLNPLEVKSIVAKPNFISLLKLKPGGTVSLSGLFGGDLEAAFDVVGKTEEKQKKFELSTDFDSIRTEKLLSFLKVPLKLTGSANGSLEIQGEESFREQPNGDFKINFENLLLPSEISLGPLPLSLPKKVKWKNSNLFGKIQKGKILIENGTLGTKSSPLNGRYKGFVNCLFSKNSQGPTANCNNYDIKVELELDKVFQQEIGQNLSGLISDSMVTKKATSTGGMKYLFKVSGHVRGAPRFQKIGTF